MENVQLRIRIGNAWDGVDGEFRNATFAEAVEALRGTTDDDGEIRAQNVYVVGTYVQGFSENVGSVSKPRYVERLDDQPAFGLEVTVYPPHNRWRTVEPARINWSALGSSDTETAAFYAQLLTMAVNLASAVNAAL